MIKQIVEVSRPSKISAKDGQLVIEQEGRVVTTPIEDLGMLLLAHPTNTITQAALGQCQEHGAAIVVCDKSYLPTAIMLPFLGTSLHAETLKLQISAKKNTTDEIWKKIVAAKIHAQSDLLAATGSPSLHLVNLVSRVSPNDSQNIEAQAAQHYWPLLMGVGFRRKEKSALNAILNYGYAVLRAAVARAIIGTGLYPAWGIFHHNRSDNFALADDLMEPLRPGVDHLAWKNRHKENDDISPELKKEILGLLSAEVLFADQRLPLWVALQRYAASFKTALIYDAEQLEIPRWAFSAV